MLGFRQAVYEKRGQVLPKNPSSLPEALDQLRNMNILTNRNEKFCFVEDDLVFPTCQKKLTFLIEHGETLLADGTFCISPRHFSRNNIFLYTSSPRPPNTSSPVVQEYGSHISTRTKIRRQILRLFF